MTEKTKSSSLTTDTKADTKDDAIPIKWIKNYAVKNGSEIKDILDYMIEEYMYSKDIND